MSNLERLLYFFQGVVHDAGAPPGNNEKQRAPGPASGQLVVDSGLRLTASPAKLAACRTFSEESFTSSGTTL
jgi:hypothetical protein